MAAVRDTSAVPWLVDLALKNPEGSATPSPSGRSPWGSAPSPGSSHGSPRPAAFLSLSLWLTVSWQTDPYYYGNDLAYLMAWLPLVLAGAPVLSADALLAERRRVRRRSR